MKGTDLAALVGAAAGTSDDQCPTCASPRRRLLALGGVNLTVCRCVAAYPRTGALRRGTAYCVSPWCRCQPAGRSRSHGALTGRARWTLARTPQAAPGSEMTLCGGCYRTVRELVRPATAEEIAAAEARWSA